MHVFFISCTVAGILTNNSYTYQDAIRKEDAHPTVILTLSLNLNGGNELVLSDHSRWVVNPEDTETSSMWLSPFPIEILKGDSEDYPVVLLNVLSQQKVRVTPSSHES